MRIHGRTYSTTSHSISHTLVLYLRLSMPSLRLPSTRLFLRMSSTSTTPVADTIRSKLTTSLHPTALDIRNDSHLHSHPQAMQGVTSKETHFALSIVSDEFKGKMQPARHRIVYGLLKEELEREGGIHALQLRTKTPEEEERLKAKEVAAG